MSVDELEGLLAKMTPRPWEATTGGNQEFELISVTEAGPLQDPAGYFLEDDAEGIVALVNVAPELLEAVKALERLASSEGFDGAGMIDGDSFPERELRARMRFADAALKGLEAAATKETP